jgi:hypothetical protein
MPISFTKYIDIQSAIAAATILAARQFGGRIYTNNQLVSPGTVQLFNSAQNVGLFFGTASEEYKRAVFYFNYTSPLITSPQQLSFSRWVDVATPVRVFGASNKASSLAVLKTIIAGVLTFVIDGVSVSLTGISFSAATSLADVAAELQTAIAANANPVLADATVTYDAVNARFVMVGSATQTDDGTITTTPAGAGITDVASNLGWYVSQGATMTNSAPAAEPVDTFIADVANNNNFGSFIFIAPGGTMPTLEQVTAVALQNKSYNVMSQYLVLVNETDWVDWQATLGEIGGLGLTMQLSTISGEYAEMQPMCVLGATQFDAVNGASGYMFTQNTLTPSVNDDILSTALDNARVNYYGSTQVNGQVVSFYQNGVLCGGATDPAAMNIFANEQWLKSFAGTSFFNLMMALKNIGANNQGKGQLLGIMGNTIIPAALNNGTISVGKDLTQEQIQFITEMTGDDKTWQQVQSIGYYYTISFTSSVAPSGITQYRARYLLIYAKDDLVMGIDGTHALI